MKRHLNIIAIGFSVILFLLLLATANVAAEWHWTFLQCETWIGGVNFEALIVSLVTTVLIAREIFISLKKTYS